MHPRDDRPKRRDRVLQAAGILMAAVSAVVAFVVGAPTTGTAGPAASTASCDGSQVAPFGCEQFDAGGFGTAWFDTRRGSPVLAIDRYGDLTLLPVTIEDGIGVTAALAATGPTRAECGADGACRSRVASAEFFTRPVVLTPTTRGFSMRSDGPVRTAARVAHFHHYQPVAAQQSNGATLLTTPERNGNQALLSGELRRNGYGCMTVGGVVLILPPTARLLHNGSVVLDGTTYEYGTIVGFGGSGGDVPGDWRCGAGERYWWL